MKVCKRFESATLLALSVVLAVVSSGCGSAPSSSSTGTSLVSKVFNTQTASFKALAARSSINSVKLCVTKLKLEAEDGNSIKHGNDDVFEAKLGIVDLNDGTQAQNWGVLNIPIGTAIKKIKIVVHKDPDNCGGVNYSANINGQTISHDLEFVFKFENTKTLVDGDIISVNLDNVVSQLIAAADANQLNDDSISHYLDGSIEDHAE